MTCLGHRQRFPIDIDEGLGNLRENEAFREKVKRVCTLLVARDPIRSTSFWWEGVRYQVYYQNTGRLFVTRLE